MQGFGPNCWCLCLYPWYWSHMHVIAAKYNILWGRLAIFSKERPILRKVSGSAAARSPEQMFGNIPQKSSFVLHLVCQMPFFPPMVDWIPLHLQNFQPGVLVFSILPVHFTKVSQCLVWFWHQQWKHNSPIYHHPLSANKQYNNIGKLWGDIWPNLLKPKGRILQSERPKITHRCSVAMVSILWWFCKTYNNIGWLVSIPNLLQYVQVKGIRSSEESLLKSIFFECIEVLLYKK